MEVQLKLGNVKKSHRPHQNWPIETKIQVVSQYLVLGNMALVSAVTGVPHQLIRSWKTQPWWKELEQQVRATENIQMDNKLSKIVDRSLDAVLDRVENGEFVYDKASATVKRRPVNFKDAAKVSVDLITKRELLRGNATERKETTTTPIGEQLKMLAMEFAKWQKPQQEVIDITDVEIKEDSDAIHDQRETRLPEGEQEVQLEAGDSESSGGEEQEPPSVSEEGSGS